MIARGSAMYWFLFLLFRLVIRRRVGSPGMADILVLVIISDAAQNAMSGNYVSVPAGMVLVATIIGWNVALDWVGFRFPALERLLLPPPLLLVRDGRMLRRNMRQEFLTEMELTAKLREHGISAIHEVERAYMEPDGEITVIKQRPRGASPR